MTKYYLLLLLCLLVSCADDDQGIIILEEACFGYNMVDTWLVTDSIENTFIGLDSIRRKVSEREMIFHENGTGKTYNDYFSSYFFFSWNIQCDPDLLTMNFPFDYDDSIVSFFELHGTYVYDILINEIDYKKMRLEQTDSIDQVERKQVVIRDITRY